MIITIDRENGSRGRELGKLLAEKLGLPFYDKESLREQELLHGISTGEFERAGRTGSRRIRPTAGGRSLISLFRYNDRTAKVLSTEQEIIRRLASQGSCVIVGCAAGAILSDLEPFKLFVYADEASRLRRAKRHHDGRNLSEKELRRQMNKTDRARAELHRAFADTAWRDPSTYHLMLDTTGVSVNTLVEGVAAYIQHWNQAKLNYNQGKPRGEEA